MESLETYLSIKKFKKERRKGRKNKKKPSSFNLVTYVTKRCFNNNKGPIALKGRLH